jgi:cell wall-associated NlpC family hydrolase
MALTNEQRQAIVTEAESWIGTPYVGWSRVKGGGVDCGQLLAAVYIATGHMDADIKLPTDYALNIGLHQASTEYIDIVLRYFREIPEADVLPGDVVVWKLTGSLAYCHAAIVKTWPNYFIHAIGSGVRAGDARSRLRFRKSDKLFFTLRDEFCEAPNKAGKS